MELQATWMICFLFLHGLYSPITYTCPVEMRIEAEWIIRCSVAAGGLDTRLQAGKEQAGT